MKLPFVLLLMLFVHSGNAQIPMTLSDTSRPGSLAAQITNEYNARIVAAGGTIQTADLNAIGTFVRHAISNGYWSYLLDCSPLAGDNTNAALQKLKIGPSASTQLLISGFTAADYARTGSFLGKATSWLDTGLAQSAFPYTNQQGAAVWFIDTMTNVNAAAELAWGRFSPSLPLFSMYSLTQSESEFFTQHNYVQSGGTSLRWGQGFYHLSRTATNRLTSYINGQSNGVSTAFQGNISTTTNSLWIYGANPDTRTLNGKRIGWFALDNGMPSTIQSNYYAGVRELMRSFGRIPRPAWNQMTFLVVGQSLATGSGPGNTTFLADRNAGATRALGIGANVVALSLVQFRKARSRLCETTVETGWRSYADHLIALSDAAGYGQTNDCLMLDWGQGGAGYVYLKKGSPNYLTRNSVTTNTFSFSTADILDQQNFQQEMVGNSLVIPAILSVHGETDLGDSAYADNMTQWKSDYETDIKAITGQTNYIPIFHSQPIVAPFPSGGAPVALSSLLMLSLHENSNGSNILVGPKYMLASSDGTHLTNTSYRVMGEYYAEAVFHQVLKGDGWDCLRPTNVTRSAAEITVTFNKSNLLLDTNWVTDPGSFGFTYYDAASPPAILSVSLAGATTNQALVTLAALPTGTNKLIRYALHATGAGIGGPKTGARGCLRDQSTAIGTTSGSNLWNYCVMFEKDVP